jgi:hypothetical protein
MAQPYSAAVEKQKANIKRRCYPLGNYPSTKSTAILCPSQLPLLEIRDTGVLSDEMANAAELTTQVARLEERVTNHIRFFWAIVAAAFIWGGWISLEITQIRGSVNPLVAAHQLTAAANYPTDAKSQAEVLRATERAKQSQVPIPTPVLAEAGKSFVAASKTDPQAWQTVKILMEYRSNVNSLTFVFPSTGLVSQNTIFALKGVLGKNPPQVSSAAAGAPIAEAARLQEIGKPTNGNVTIGTSHLLLTGGATSLDNMDIAHAIFVGVEVHYSGAPSLLDDVLFVNCTFVFDNSERSRMLAENIIASRNVTFPSS